MNSYLDRLKSLPGSLAALWARFHSTLLVLRRAYTEPIPAVFALAARVPQSRRARTLRFTLSILDFARRVPRVRVTVAPLSVAVAATLGRTDDAVGRIEAARHHFSQPVCRARFAQVALRIGRLDLAQKVLDGLHGTHPSVQEARANVLIRSGRLQEGLEILQPLIDQGRASHHAQRQCNFARGRATFLRREWTWTPPPLQRPLDLIPGRILHLVTNSLPYKHAGYTVRTHSIAKSQRAVGLAPYVLTRAGFPQLQGFVSACSREAIDQVPYYRIPIKNLTTPPDDEAARLTAEGLLRLALEVRPSCLHPASYHFNAQVALAVARHVDLPVIYEVRGFLEETWLSSQGTSADEISYYQWSKAAETYCMRSAQHVVTLSNVMKAEIESRGVPEDRVTIVPNAVDETYFTPGPQPPQLRIDCSLPPDTPIIGYIGSIVDYEGLPLLLHAVRKLRDSGLRFHFLCVGDGPELTGLMKTAANLNIRENVTFTGPVSHAQTLSYYRLLDLFVIPRRDLPVCRLVTPLKPVEAMACGIPVVTSHLPPLVELTGEGAAGPSFKAGSVEHLALALERLVGDQALRHAHAAQARDRVIKYYTWTQNAQRYADLYSQLGAL